MVLGHVDRAVAHDRLTLREALEFEVMLADDDTATNDRGLPDAYAV